MEGETNTREPTSGDRLRRYNSKTMSLLRQRETGKADLAGRVQLARIEKQVCVLNVCAHHCGQKQHRIKLVHKRYLQRTQNLGYVFNDQFYNLNKACACCLKFEYVYRF